MMYNLMSHGVHHFFLLYGGRYFDAHALDPKWFSMLLQGYCVSLERFLLIKKTIKNVAGS